jgi:MoaA/NifB/PqqE/SkfB family radical SAM enzyme
VKANDGQISGKMSRKLTLREMVIGGCRFFHYLLRGGLFNVNLEVTKRCNARCDFCDYWKEAPAEELADYVPVLRRLQPLSVSLTGGEPLLRKDLAEIVASLRRNFGFLVIGLITNGWLLTPDRGRELWEAGLDELSISLDYLDERHDRERGLPGLTRHILAVIPALKEAGVKVCFNLVIKKGNYREIPAFLERAAALGVRVSLSTYNCWRTGNDRHMLGPEDLPALQKVLAYAKDFKRHRDTLASSDFYLDHVSEFFRNRGVAGCTAGLNWVQVTPDGMIKRCSDQPVACHYTHWRPDRFGPTDCRRCWYACRGAAQEPWTFRRFLELSREALL